MLPQVAGGQQSQVGSWGVGDAVKMVSGWRRRWKAEGKKARMKMARKTQVLVAEVNGMVRVGAGMVEGGETSWRIVE
jgi:hypothetical protein